MKVLLGSSCILASTLVAMSACQVDAVPDDRSGSSGTTNGSGSTTGTGANPMPTQIGAPGVHIRQIAIYQGLKRTLVVDGVPAVGEVPLVAGRDAIVRVFYEVGSEYDGSEVLGRLSIEGFPPLETSKVLPREPSVEERLDSTLTFAVPGDHVGTTFTYSVALLGMGLEADDNAAARYPASGTEAVTVEGKANTFRVKIAPIRYDADGSGRLPDTSPAAVEIFRAKLLQLFPVSNVEVTVRAPEPWDKPLGNAGEGWDALINKVISLRGADDAPDDLYYFGMFNPTATFDEYCADGCVAGVTLLNNDPQATGEVDLRASMGIGYPGYVQHTAAHELAHAHGRTHAPCGATSLVDSKFPHEGGKIGVWGLDPATLTQFDPETTTDFLGYCEVEWVSDYTYKGLLARIANVNLPRTQGDVRAPVTLVSFDAAGNTTWGGSTRMSSRIGGKPARARVFRERGAAVQVDARWFAYDHIEGGTVVVRAPAEGIRLLELEIDGRWMSVSP